MNTIFRSEVTIIDKQKFLAELGRLLTFMYEEDRQLALSMYEKMFDSCPDIHALMQILVSPTRQAVVIARAYDATDRKLQVYSSSREEDGIEDEGQLPDFVLAIDELYQTAVDRGLLGYEESSSQVLENQISLFEELEEDEAVLEEEPAAEQVEEPVVEEAPEEADVPVDEVDAFLASFAIADSELIPEEPAPAEAAAEAEEPAQEEQTAVEEAVQETLLEEEVVSESVQAPVKTVRKPRVFLLILYIILASPVTLVGLALLLIPTVLVLAAASAVILTGSATFVAAFSGFAVFADLLVVLGTALVILAVGLILLWLFVWFIGGAMVGLVKAIVRLGSRCCYKEVPAV